MTLLDALVRGLDAAPAGVEVELSALCKRQLALRLAVGAMSEAGDSTILRVRVRVAMGTRVGSVLVGDASERGIAAAMAEATERARRSPPRAHFGGFADAALDVHAAPATHDADVLFRAAGSALGEARASRITLAGSLSATRVEHAVATTAGARATTTTQAYEAALQGNLDDSDASARAELLLDEARLDVAPLVGALAAQLAAGREREDVAIGAHDVVLGPAAVAELCEWLALIGLGARSVLDGASFAAGLTGAASWMTLADDPSAFGTLAAAFDAEGTPTPRLALVKEGRAVACAHDRSTAREAAMSPFGERGSTGHAAPIDDDLADGHPLPRHLVLEAGADDSATLIAGVDDGLYLPRLHYVNGLLDPPRAVMTGLTRHGARRIVRGQLAGAIRDLRFTDAMLDALTRVDGVGREVATLRGSVGLVRCPAVRLRGLLFSDRSG
jgi:predicted Zn-dependent protease